MQYKGNCILIMWYITGSALTALQTLDMFHLCQISSNEYENNVMDFDSFPFYDGLWVLSRV